MKVLSSTLPSKGLLSPISEIDIKPLTYSQIKNYQSRHYENKVEQLCWDIECLMSNIEGYQSLSIYDLKSIIFTIKYTSASFNESINVKVKGKPVTIKLKDINFKEISPELLSIAGIVLNGEMLSFSVPTVGQVYELLKVTSTDSRYDYNDIVLICALGGSKDNFNHISNLILNATAPQDILMIDYLDDLLNNVTDDITVEGGAVVNISDIITDIFQLIKLNRKLDRTKIITK